MNLIKKIWIRRHEIYYLPASIYFNFHYLCIKDAIKLPILLYKPTLKKMKGSVRIDAPVKYGMIRLGFPQCSIYPNNGIMWENHGGEVVFKGKGIIGNDTYLTFGPKTKFEIGNDFINTAGLKLVSYRGVKIGEHSRFGWGVLLMDTNIHPLYDLVKKKFKRASGPIEIGDCNWFGTECKIMHSVKTPERCIFGMGTIVTRGCEMKPFCVMGGNPVRVLSENVIRDYNHEREDD